MSNLPDLLYEHCRNLPAVTEDVKWDNDLVFSVGKKMFAVFLLPEGDSFSFKVDEDLFHSLVQQPGIEPAPYLARHSWVRVGDPGALPLETVKDFLARSYELVVARLPKKLQRELDLEIKSSSG